MSAQGGSLNSPIHVPTRPLLAGVAALLLALAIGLGISQLGHEPTDGFGGTADIPMNGFGRIPEQRLHPIDIGATFDIPMNGFGRIPEQRLHPIDFDATFDVPMNGFGRIPEQRLHPIDSGGTPADISLPEPPSLVWARAGGPRPLEP
jgi:hypothetical protein